MRIRIREHSIPPGRRTGQCFGRLNKEQDNLLADDHSQLAGMLDEIFAALQNGDQVRSFAELDMFWARLAMHIRAEHVHLFPALLKTVLTDNVATQSVEMVIERLRADHNFFMGELAETIKTMREIPRENDGGSLPNLAAVKERLENVGRRLVIHNDIEESQIYPLADLVLVPDEAARIRGNMKRELEKLPPRFADDPLT